MFLPRRRSPGGNACLDLCLAEVSASPFSMKDLAILCQQRAALCVIACMRIVYMNVARGSEKDVSCSLRKLNSGLYRASRLRADTWASGSQTVSGEETGDSNVFWRGKKHGSARPPGMAGRAKLRGAAHRACWLLRSGPTLCLDIRAYYSVQDSVCAGESPALTA